MRQFRRILHPTDFSRASGPAFAKAVALAEQNRAELLLVHVLVPPTPVFGDGYIPPKAYEALETDARRGADRRLSALLARARKAKVRAKILLLDGVPYDQIARIAQSRRADLIVMGTHGRTGLSKFFVGSVAERVIVRAPCPVLTVRAREGRARSVGGPGARPRRPKAGPRRK